MKRIILIAIVLVMAAAVVSASDYSWSTVDVDPITDEVFIIIAIAEHEGNGALYYRDTDGYIEIFTKDLNSSIGEGNDNAIIRFDSEDPIKLIVGPSTDGVSKFFSRSDTEMLRDKMLESLIMVVRVYKFDNTPVTFIFDLSDFAAEYDKYY